MCTFTASCCSARKSRAQVPAFTGSSVRDRRKKGGGGGGGGSTACTGVKLYLFKYTRSVLEYFSGK